MTASFEEKELKVTTRLLYGIVVQTAIYVGTAVLLYAALRSDIRDNKTYQQGVNQLMEEKIKSQQLENSILVKELEGTNARVSEIENNILQKKN